VTLKVKLEKVKRKAKEKAKKMERIIKIKKEN
jgi:hypothetical protein